MSTYYLGLTGGSNVLSVDEVANDIGYAAYIFNDESQNYHVRNREYSPQLGRFLQRDPIRYAAGMNLYQYVNSSPGNYNDPFGLMPPILIPEEELESEPSQSNPQIVEEEEEGLDPNKYYVIPLEELKEGEQIIIKPNPNKPGTYTITKTKSDTVLKAYCVAGMEITGIILWHFGIVSPAGPVLCIIAVVVGLSNEDSDKMQNFPDQGFIWPPRKRRPNGSDPGNYGPRFRSWDDPTNPDGTPMGPNE